MRVVSLVEILFLFEDSTLPPRPPKIRPIDYYNADVNTVDAIEAFRVSIF